MAFCRFVQRRITAPALAPVALAVLLSSCSSPVPDNEGTPARSGAAASPAAGQPAAFAPETLPPAERLALAMKAAGVMAQAGDADMTPSLRRIDGRWVLLNPVRDGDCHGCSGALEIRYLNVGEKGFEPAGSWPDMIGGGSWGAPPDWQIREDLMPVPVIAASGGGTWQGYSCSSMTLVALTPDKPLLMAEAIPVSYDNGGAVADAGEAHSSVTGRIMPVRKGQRFDMIYQGSPGGTVRYSIGKDGKATAAEGYAPPTC
ncbi:hypothetical protein [Sphingobium aquiterrae]|uniref:hypothetical protein n=1 Tax=Sphingobium aquiterrae TaxID=2038656 RepID=UPI00301959AC